MDELGQKGRKKMRNKRLFRYCKMPLDLQHFAEPGDGTGADGGNGDGSDGGSVSDGNGVNGSGAEGKRKGGDNPPSFDDLLKDGHQAEFDRRVQKAIDTALTNAQEKWQALTDDKLSEAEKLAKMNKDEKAQYLVQKHEKELADREIGIVRRELMAEAKNTLTEKKLPVGLAEVLNYTDADSCNKSIAAVEKAFQGAVEEAVQHRLKGGNPPTKAPGADDSDLAKQVESLMMGA